jgi:hypothetical protein
MKNFMQISALMLTSPAPPLRELFHPQSQDHGTRNFSDAIEQWMNRWNLLKEIIIALTPVPANIPEAKKDAQTSRVSRVFLKIGARSLLATERGNFDEPSNSFEMVCQAHTSLHA